MPVLLRSRRPQPGVSGRAAPAGRAGRDRPVRLVELPVGASTDRLTGTLDIEKALTEGEKAFEPGLLAAAHRGILYVDEVNLLSDHLVDLCCWTWRRWGRTTSSARASASGTRRALCWSGR